MRFINDQPVVDKKKVEIEYTKAELIKNGWFVYKNVAMKIDKISGYKKIGNKNTIQFIVDSEFLEFNLEPSAFNILFQELIKDKKEEL